MVHIVHMILTFFSESQSSVDIHGHIRNALTPFKHMIHHVTHGNDQEIFQLNYLVSKQQFFVFHTLYQAQAKRDRWVFEIGHFWTKLIYFQGMSWPPRSSRGQQGGQGQGGTNSLPLGAINDPMDMGQMRNSLNNIGKNSSATFGNMSQVKIL